MSFRYLVVFYPKTSEQIQPDSFVGMLNRRWSNIQIKHVEDPNDAYLLEWAIPCQDGSYFLGFLNRNLQAISLKGSIQESADFAIWFQQNQPDVKNLIFVDEQGSFNVDLHDRTVDEVIQLAEEGYSFLRRDHY